MKKKKQKLNHKNESLLVWLLIYKTKIEDLTSLFIHLKSTPNEIVQKQKERSNVN